MVNAILNRGIWTPERKALVTDLWKQGLSASQIANKLDVNVTRNAVIGILHRMKEQGRNQPERLTRARIRSVASGASKANYRKAAKVRSEGPSRAKLATVTETMRSRAWAPLEGSTPRVWTDRKGGECKWPIDVPGEEMHACCQATAGHPTYCPSHRAMATVRKTEPVTSTRRSWVELRRAA